MPSPASSKGNDVRTKGDVEVSTRRFLKDIFIGVRFLNIKPQSSTLNGIWKKSWSMEIRSIKERSSCVNYVIEKIDGRCSSPGKTGLEQHFPMQNIV